MHLTSWWNYHLLHYDIFVHRYEWRNYVSSFVINTLRGNKTNNAMKLYWTQKQDGLLLNGRKILSQVINVIRTVCLCWSKKWTNWNSLKVLVRQQLWQNVNRQQWRGDSLLVTTKAMSKHNFFMPSDSSARIILECLLVFTARRKRVGCTNKRRLINVLLYVCLSSSRTTWYNTYFKANYCRVRQPCFVNNGRRVEIQVEFVDVQIKASF